MNSRPNLVEFFREHIQNIDRIYSRFKLSKEEMAELELHLPMFCFNLYQILERADGNIQYFDLQRELRTPSGHKILKAFVSVKHDYGYEGRSEFTDHLNKILCHSSEIGIIADTRPGYNMRLSLSSKGIRILLKLSDHYIDATEKERLRKKARNMYNTEKQQERKRLEAERARLTEEIADRQKQLDKISSDK